MTDLPRPPAALERYRSLFAPVADGSLYAGIWEPEPDQGMAGTLLAVHGITGTHLTWQWLAQELPDWRIIAVDLRGRGRSNTLPENYGLAQHCDDLVALLNAAGVIEPVTVVGHSMGGFVALALADRAPDRVRQLLLIDGGIPVQLPEGVAPEEALTLVLGATLRRLQAEYATPAEVDTFWQNHPGLRGQWGPELAAYAAYDINGIEPHLHSSTGVSALVDDTRDIQLGDTLPLALANLRHPAQFLRAERDLQDRPGGLYATDWVTTWADQLDQLTAADIP
ncbi:MAG: alpha/beta hydrolase, partial [Propionibacteriaceae bacterium]|nr:alpha/beta hydrolase [Propionibacteriaceae bacterium]